MPIWSIMMPWLPELQSNQPKNLMQSFPFLMVPYMKFGQNWLTDFRDILPPSVDPEWGDRGSGTPPPLRKTTSSMSFYTN